VFGDVIRISVDNCVLLKSISSDHKSGPYVDSAMTASAKLGKIPFITVTIGTQLGPRNKLTDYFSSVIRMTPFGVRLPPTRTALTGQFL